MANYHLTEWRKTKMNHAILISLCPHSRLMPTLNPIIVTIDKRKRTQKNRAPRNLSRPLRAETAACLYNPASREIYVTKRPDDARMSVKPFLFRKVGLTRAARAAAHKRAAVAHKGIDGWEKMGLISWGGIALFWVLEYLFTKWPLYDCLRGNRGDETRF